MKLYTTYLWNILDGRKTDKNKPSYSSQNITIFTTYYVWERQQGRESRILDFSSQNCRRILWYNLYVRPYIVLARDWGSKATNDISTFTPSKIISLLQRIFYRIEQSTEQDKSIVRLKIRIQHGGFPTQPQLKVRLTLLFWKKYFFHYYSFEKSTLFTTNILQTVF